MVKSPEIDIANFLSAYEPKHVKAGIRLWANEYVVTKGRLKKQLRDFGWYPVPEKPKGREYYEIDGEYWVQDAKKHEELVKEQLKKAREEEKKMPKVRSVTDFSDIRETSLKCPKCGGNLYRQPICPGCKEGKQGYRVRLICGENADHEFLV